MTAPRLALAYAIDLVLGDGPEREDVGAGTGGGDAHLLAGEFGDLRDLGVESQEGYRVKKIYCGDSKWCSLFGLQTYRVISQTKKLRSKNPIATIFVLVAESIDLFFHKKVGVADILDLNPAKHLADDDLDVLVVDIDALQAINFLDLVDEIIL